MSSRNWCFTWFTDLTANEVIALLPPAVKYCVFQQELCPNTGREHYQGYLEFKTSRRLPKTIIDPEVHWELRNGTQAQARDYCMKEESRISGPWEFGTFAPEQPGKRNDLEPVVQAIQAGAQSTDIAAQFPMQYIRYHSGIDKICSHAKIPKPVPRVVWLWGPSGVGKSRLAKQSALCEDDVLQEGVDYAFSNPPPRTFQEYNTKIPRFIFDDYCPKHIPHRDLKRYLDRNPITVNIMYSSVQFVPIEIIITCSRPPSEIWCGNELREIERRCTEIRELTE